jgi:choline dehydrogenase-like flavoprotein
MHIDLHKSGVAGLRTEVCVIGAGVAGILMARRLLSLGHNVVLVESGGTDFEEATAELNKGESVGEPYYELEDSRLRFFGGSANIWGGRVAELDPIDFEPRDWVPYSGWPLKYDDLQPYYRQAWQALGAEPPDESALRQKLKCPDFDEQQLQIRFWGFDKQSSRFSFGAARDLTENPNCLVVTHATVTEIVTDQSGTKVEEVLVQRIGGPAVPIQARAFVVAAGGIENPRLLLASRRHSPSGIGNAHDLVGRFFMEHPHARGGRVLSPKSWQLLNAFGRSHWHSGQRVAALIAPALEQQAAKGILNTSLTIAPRLRENARPFAAMRIYNKAKHDLAPTRFSRGAWRMSKRLVTSLQSVADPTRPWLLHRLGMMDLALLVRAEQAPNPDSRVLLSDRRDSLGVQQVKLDWRLSELDKNSVAVLVDLLSSECRRLGLGKVEPAQWLDDPEQAWRTDPLISAHPIGGYHHIGTTRMGSSERQGVADSFGNVFGVHNLFLAGSSLFPTSGWANPTLTLMALALRTSDRLSARLREPEACAGTAGVDAATAG